MRHQMMVRTDNSDFGRYSPAYATGREFGAIRRRGLQAGAKEPSTHWGFRERFSTVVLRCKMYGKGMNAARQILRRLDRAMGTRTCLAADYYINATISIKSDPLHHAPVGKVKGPQGETKSDTGENERSTGGERGAHWGRHDPSED